MEKTEGLQINRNRFIVMPGINRFSERLKLAMGRLTNVALAEKCGISESAVRSYLKGKSYPGIDKIEAIASACDAPLIWLITGQNFAPESDSGALFCESEVSAVLGLMSATQRKSLAAAVVEHGISGILAALNGMAEVSEFLQLSENERAQALRVLAMVKKGADQVGQIDTSAAPAGIKKQAG